MSDFFNSEVNAFVGISKNSDSHNSDMSTVPSSTASTNQYNFFPNIQNVTAQIEPESTLELVAKWFLNKTALSNKKIQKLCYYAYCWFIVFFNDLEAVEMANTEIKVLSSEKFQAWIHGPVNPKLYHKYKKYGWNLIPKEENAPRFEDQIESLLNQVWNAYGTLSADELEALSHQEYPWQNARRGIPQSESCNNEINDYDILKYYSSLR